MLKKVMVAGVLAAFLAPAAIEARVYVEVTNGNVDALRLAIDDANGREPTEPTTIFAQGRFFVGSKTTLPPISSSIEISGGEFKGVNGGPSTLFSIAQRGSLLLRGVELFDFTLTSSAGLIDNKGQLTLSLTRFSRTEGRGSCTHFGYCFDPGAIITNHASGTLEMDRVSFEDSGIRPGPGGERGPGILSNAGQAVIKNTQVYLEGGRWNSLFANVGYLKLHNSSFLYQQFFEYGSGSLLIAGENSEAEAVNSVFAGLSGEFCGKVHSIGYNLTDAADCSWSRPVDLVGIPTGLLWRPVTEAEQNGTPFTHALIPAVGSPAVDSARSDSCPGRSLLADGRIESDGNGDGIPGCDRGAVELVQIRLAEGGINGLYYMPESDGHYFYVLENDANTLVLWNTFDADGNLAWVYGIGRLRNGRSVSAEAYINRGGRLAPNGIIEGAAAEGWGRLDVEMISCSEGVVRFQSELPGFGAGQFPIRRLANVKQLGCIDP